MADEAFAVTNDDDDIDQQVNTSSSEQMASRDRLHAIQFMGYSRVLSAAIGIIVWPHLNIFGDRCPRGSSVTFLGQIIRFHILFLMTPSSKVL